MPGGLRYSDPNNLGEHTYNGSRGEEKGLLYAKHAGFIDLGHLRESADTTYYAQKTILDSLENKLDSFSFKLVDPVQFHIFVSYPENVNEEDRKEVSIIAGEHIAYNSKVFHEIATWYNFSSTGFSEHTSSFSPEDLPSDITGAHLAGIAIREGGDFEKAFKLVLDDYVKEAGAVSIYDCKKAVKKIKGEWYSGFWPFTVMKERNFDTGHDGYLSPWLVPDSMNYPISFKFPSLNEVEKYGFCIEVKVEPTMWESKKILSLVDKEKFLDIEEDFPRLVEIIKKEAKK